MDAVERRLVAWWAVLVGASFVSFKAGGSADAGRFVVVTLLIFLLTLGKTSIVILQFMDVRTAPAPLKLALLGWASILAAVLTILWVR